MKYVTRGGIYRFELYEKHKGFVEITVDSFLGTDHFWGTSIKGSKSWIKREYGGIDLDRWKKIEENE